MKPDGSRNKLPKTIELPAGMLNDDAQEAWRVFGIMSEFVAASEKLNQIRPGVSIFGSARVKPGHPYYEKTERIGLQSDPCRARNAAQPVNAPAPMHREDWPHP